MEERTIPILDQILCIRLDVNIWSGQKKLTAEDLGLTPDQIPPEELAALGRKRICDPQALAIFNKLKQRGDRLLKSNGVRFMDGYAVPKAAMAQINAQIDDLGEEFREAKKEFLAEYDNTVETWVARHPDWTEQLRKAIVPGERVAAALHWRRSCFRVVHPERGDDPGLTVEVEGLGGQLLREVAQEAKETWEHSYQDKEEVTRRALRPLNRIYQKMLSLSFLEPRVRPFLDLMIAVIHQADSLPGRIERQALGELQSLLHLLMDPGKILAGNYQVFRVAAVPPAVATVAQPPQALGLVLEDLEPEEDETVSAAETSPVQTPEPLAAPPTWFF